MGAVRQRSTYGYHVWMLESARGARLLCEPLERLLTGSVAREDLDRDVPPERPIVGEKHRAGGSSSELFLDDEPSREAVPRGRRFQLEQAGTAGSARKGRCETPALHSPWPARPEPAWSDSPIGSINPCVDVGQPAPANTAFSLRSARSTPGAGRG